MDKAISFVFGFAACNLVRVLWRRWAQNRPLPARESAPGD